MKAMFFLLLNNCAIIVSNSLLTHFFQNIQNPGLMISLLREGINRFRDEVYLGIGDIQSQKRTIFQMQLIPININQSEVASSSSNKEELDNQINIKSPMFC